MKLGTQTGSLVNHLHSRSTLGRPEPVVGMGVTMLSWSDRTPGTIYQVFKIGKLTAVEVREDTYRRTDSNGMSECQDYEYTPNENGHVTFYRRADCGEWEQVRKNPETGRWGKGYGGRGLRLGVRERYYDFSF